MQLNFLLKMYSSVSDYVLYSKKNDFYFKGWLGVIGMAVLMSTMTLLTGLMVGITMRFEKPLYLLFSVTESFLTLMLGESPPQYLVVSLLVTITTLFIEQAVAFIIMIKSDIAAYQRLKKETPPGGLSKPGPFFKNVLIVTSLLSGLIAAASSTFMVLVMFGLDASLTNLNIMSAPTIAAPFVSIGPALWLCRRYNQSDKVYPYLPATVAACLIASDVPVMLGIIFDAKISCSGLTMLANCFSFLALLSLYPWMESPTSSGFRRFATTRLMSDALRRLNRHSAYELQRAAVLRQFQFIVLSKLIAWLLMAFCGTTEGGLHGLPYSTGFLGLCIISMLWGHAAYHLMACSLAIGQTQQKTHVLLPLEPILLYQMACASYVIVYRSAYARYIKKLEAMLTAYPGQPVANPNMLLKIALSVYKAGLPKVLVAHHIGFFASVVNPSYGLDPEWIAWLRKYGRTSDAVQLTYVNSMMGSIKQGAQQMIANSGAVVASVGGASAFYTGFNFYSQAVLIPKDIDGAAAVILSNSSVRDCDDPILQGAVSTLCDASHDAKNVPVHDMVSWDPLRGSVYTHHNTANDACRTIAQRCSLNKITLDPEASSSPLYQGAVVRSQQPYVEPNKLMTENALRDIKGNVGDVLKELQVPKK